jgi:molecular chaperone DnaK (HSP70)
MAVFGLHIGDYQSVITIHKNEKIEVLANESGERETPTLVRFKDGNILTGSAAKQSLHRNIHWTAHSMPSLLAINGKNNQLAKTIIDSSLCKIREGDDNHLCYHYEQDTSSKKTSHLTVYDSLVHVLKQIHATARLHESHDVIPCVAAVPINYTQEQQQMLNCCLKESGFNVLSMSISPALALLPYDMDKVSFSGHVMVFDVGLRTLTLTIFNIINGMIRLVDYNVTHGVGGAYLDQAIVDVLRGECKRTFLNFNETESIKLKLMTAAENVKHSLSKQQTANVCVESLHDGMDLQCSIVRGRFEGVCHHIFQSCLEPLQGVLESSNLTANDIHKVVLVGGTCKIPRLQQLVKEWFPSSQILCSAPPDHVISLGAAIQAQYHTQYLQHYDYNTSIPCTSSDIWIHRVNCVDSVGVVLMNRHTPLPSQKTVIVDVKRHDADKDVLLSLKEGSDEHLPNIAEINIPYLTDTSIQLEVTLLWNIKDDVTLKVINRSTGWSETLKLS